jgi:hypothetical protein
MQAMTKLKTFDFTCLDSPEFKEDAVREELITPFLHALGYQCSGDYKICRSKSVQSLFVNVGSQKRSVIIPDYLLQIKDKPAWVLDAKHPSENIHAGSNVNQVYSYAIHPEIRVDLYALCNGHELTVFNISKQNSIFTIRLKDISTRWSETSQILSPESVLNYQIKAMELTKLEISALKAIFEFEVIHPLNPSQMPDLYTVNLLKDDLKISWEEANKIFGKIRLLDLIAAPFDNIATFHNPHRRINEARPGRLSESGILFLIQGGHLNH